MNTFHSNGKLLLTGEYVVLDGAKALALPSNFGQSLEIKPIDESKLFWKSIDYNGNIWYKSELSINSLVSSFSKNENPISKRLFEILISAKQLNPNFLNSESGFSITTKLDFPKNWGLGSSSTLINNIANWANVNAFDLLELTFGGSGYDIACAQHNNPITYKINPLNKTNVVNLVNFNPSYKDNLFFIHLNKKQNSREGIRRYNANKNNITSTILEINSITESIISCKTLSDFEILTSKHEEIISKLINLPTVKSSLFPDYSRAIKSLGAWGGDFILAAGSHNDMDYFNQKGYTTVIPYADIIL